MKSHNRQALQILGALNRYPNFWFHARTSKLQLLHMTSAHHCDHGAQVLPPNDILEEVCADDAVISIAKISPESLWLDLLFCLFESRLEIEMLPQTRNCA